MKLKIEKTPHGAVILELTYETTKAPLKHRMSDGEAMVLAKLIETAARADSFRFELDLPK